MDVKSSTRGAAVAPRRGQFVACAGRTLPAWKPAVAALALCSALLAAAGPAAAQICPQPETTEPGTPGPGGPPSTPPGGPPDSPPGGPPDSPPGGPPGGEEPEPTACPPINPPDGAISATPAVCTIPAGGSTCSSTIAWWSQNLSNVQVKVFSHATGTTQLFAAGASGTQAAPWITAAGFRFDLLSGSTVWDSVEVKGNRSPAVSLTAPASGAVFLAPGTLGLSASASDTDGTLSKVEFFNGATLLNTDTTAPYSFTWSNVPAGSYSLTAKATDNLGAATTSAAVPVTVSTATVKLTAANKLVESVVAAPGTAAASFRLAQAGKIRFQKSVGGAWVEQAPLDEWLEPESLPLAANFEVLATPVSGTLSGGTVNQWLALSAARDWTLTRSVVGTSQAVVRLQIRRIGTTTVLGTADVTLKATVDSPPNLPPAVTLTSPVNGAVVNEPGSFTVTASASDPDGTVTQVEFFKNSETTPFKTLFAPSSFSFPWSDVPAGTYVLTAQATDNDGATKTSPAVTVTVNALPSVTLAPLATQNAPCTWTLSATASDADGTISQVQFFNGGVALTGTASNPNPDTTAPYGYTWSAVPAGTYTLTATATDNRGAVATSEPVPAVCAGPPMATLTAPSNNTSYTRPNGPQWAATASTSAGTISQVEFLDNGVVIGADTTANAAGVYTFPSDTTSWDTTTVAAGSHSLTARATNSLGTVGPPSEAVTITVVAPPNQAPTATLTAPANGASFTAGEPIPLTATASDPDGTVSQVEFLSDGAAIGPGTAGANNTWTFNWPDAATGTHAITAQATDNLGLTGPASAPVSITVNPAPAPCFTLPPRPLGAP